MKLVLSRLLIVFAILTTPSFAQSRIKDIVDVEGLRDNLLVGYGLVVGLDGTGDDLTAAVFTRESLVGMLERLGVSAANTDLSTDNVAAVMVTATLPPFSRQGTRIDVSLGTLGDATSLQGGTLLVTPLVGADGEVYAVAQGAVALTGLDQQAAQGLTRGVPTAAKISDGAIVEREIAFDFNRQRRTVLALRNPDITTAKRIAETINLFLAVDSADVIDPGTIRLTVPTNFVGGMVDLLAEIERLPVTSDLPARVVVDESAGVIVVGDSVRISRVAIAQGNLSVRIVDEPSRPFPFSNTGETLPPPLEAEPTETVERQLGILDDGISLHELVEGLNALGVGPRDMISILQTIKAAGALQAEIEII